MPYTRLSFGVLAVAVVDLIVTLLLTQSTQGRAAVGHTLPERLSTYRLVRPYSYLLVGQA